MVQLAVICRIVLRARVHIYILQNSKNKKETNRYLLMNWLILITYTNSEKSLSPKRDLTALSVKWWMNKCDTTYQNFHVVPGLIPKRQNKFLESNHGYRIAINTHSHCHLSWKSLVIFIRIISFSNTWALFPRPQHHPSSLLGRGIAKGFSLLVQVPIYSRYVIHINLLIETISSTIYFLE